MELGNHNFLQLLYYSNSASPKNQDAKTSGCKFEDR